jgi:putative membrane protein
MKAERLFSEAEKVRISAAIGAVEKTTAGEIAVMVVDGSDTYPEGRILAGVLPGGLLALAATDLFFADSLWLFVPLAVLLAGLIGWAVRFLPAVHRLFVPANRLEARVQARALQAFYEEGLYKTKEATGVLFFISLFEHTVWILADKGIYEKIEPETLQAYARDMAQSIRGHRAAEVLCREIGNVGEILARHFPPRPDDTDELSNRVLIG